MIKAFKLILPTTLLLISSQISCNKEQEDLTKMFEDKIKTTISDLSKNPSQPVEEMKKLHQIEYKTLVFPLEENPEIIDKKLNELGIDRWQCFSSFARPRSKPNEPEMVVLCKRAPETVLRFIPNSILGR